jgi:hypothetical protein
VVDIPENREADRLSALLLPDSPKAAHLGLITCETAQYFEAKEALVLVEEGYRMHPESPSDFAFAKILCFPTVVMAFQLSFGGRGGFVEMRTFTVFL